MYPKSPITNFPPIWDSAPSCRYESQMAGQRTTWPLLYAGISGARLRYPLKRLGGGASRAYPPRLGVLALGTVIGLAALGVGILALWSDGTSAGLPKDNAPSGAIALAVVGDSNSHSYQDSISFPSGTALRGGPLHSRTFQWTEVLARLRGQELDQGPWVVWGRPGMVAWGRELIGLPGGRASKKEDYLYNFAHSGATCGQLMGGWPERLRQVPPLVHLMDEDPQRWRDGVVVIRIGDNDWHSVLDLQARDPKAPEVRAVVTHCVEQIRAAIRLINTAHSTTRILLVGVDNGADDPERFDNYRSTAATTNIRAAVDDFNAQLRALANGDTRIAFFDGDLWSRQIWGSRRPDGTPDFRPIIIGGKLRVTYTVGNEPNNAVLPDDHVGLVWNALLAQALVARMREAFSLPLTPISDEELARFVANP